MTRLLGSGAPSVAIRRISTPAIPTTAWFPGRQLTQCCYSARCGTNSWVVSARCPRGIVGRRACGILFDSDADVCTQASPSLCDFSGLIWPSACANRAFQRMAKILPEYSDWIHTCTGDRLYLKSMNLALKIDEFCIKNDGFCSKNDVFCIWND